MIVSLWLLGIAMQDLTVDTAYRSSRLCGGVLQLATPSFQAVFEKPHGLQRNAHGLPELVTDALEEIWTL